MPTTWDQLSLASTEVADLREYGYDTPETVLYGVAYAPESFAQLLADTTIKRLVAIARSMGVPTSTGDDLKTRYPLGVPSASTSREIPEHDPAFESERSHILQALETASTLNERMEVETRLQELYARRSHAG